jgi:predicted RNA-binding protein with RPS1 domain
MLPRRLHNGSHKLSIATYVPVCHSREGLQHVLLLRGGDAPSFVCPQEVFQVGDRVRSVVLSQEDYSRFSLSTAELEEQPGDMLRDKVPSS